MTVSGKRILPVVLGLFITSAIVSSALPLKAYAVTGQITPRKLLLSTSAPGGTATHTFTFTAPTTATIGSISFTYCTKARDVSCVVPGYNSSTSDSTGDMNAAGAGVGTTTGLTGTWTVSGTPTANSVVIAGTGTDIHGVSVTVPLTSIVNPNLSGSPNLAFYVDIKTFTSADGTGTPIDEGWVAGATSNQIQLQGTMPESLIFCTGSSITTNAGVPDCSTATNAVIDFSQLFSPTSTATATSVMAASTNASGGYAITYSGPTLTSGGSNTITPMDNGSGGATTSVVGKSQFGLNLAVNTTPTVGAVITPASNADNLRAKAATNYDTADNFMFSTSGATVANSNDGGAGGSDIQMYTVSYMVNVNGAQTAGTYATTLTYICTSTF